MNIAEQLVEKFTNIINLKLTTEIKAKTPTVYKKAYGEIYKPTEEVDYYLVNNDTKKILAGFKAYNIPKWAYKVEDNENYELFSSHTLKYPAPYIKWKGGEEMQPINVKDPNNWDATKVNSFIKKYNVVNK